MVIMVMVPLADAYVSQRFRLAPVEKDLKFSQASCILLSAGFAMIGLAESPQLMVLGLIISALDATFLATLRSAMTSFVSPVFVGTLYTATSAAQGIGVLISGPLLALIFTWGLSLGGFWIGSPYLLVSALYLVAFLAIICLRQLRGYKLSRSTLADEDMD
jgi:MFS family permease